MTLTWGICDRCGGALPLVDYDNGHPALPCRPWHGGDCPGWIAEYAVCGAFEGWSPGRIERYVARALRAAEEVS